MILKSTLFPGALGRSLWPLSKVWIRFSCLLLIRELLWIWLVFVEAESAKCTSLEGLAFFCLWPPIGGNWHQDAPLTRYSDVVDTGSRVWEWVMAWGHSLISEELNPRWIRMISSWDSAFGKGEDKDSFPTLLLGGSPGCRIQLKLLFQLNFHHVGNLGTLNSLVS